MKKLATIIHYSSLDNAFIGDVIKHAAKFSDVYILSYKDFFDESIDVDSIGIFIVDEDSAILTTYIDLQESDDIWFHHNYLRHQGYLKAKEHYDYDAYLFLDGDEVPDSKLMTKWLETYDYETDYKMANYWYYRDTCYRADQIEDSIALITKRTAENIDFYLPQDRNTLSQNFFRYETYNKQPMFHHYSWAKPKKALYDKIRLFVHKDDADYKRMLDIEFSQPFDYTCPFNNYTFKEVEPFINVTFNQ